MNVEIVEKSQYGRQKPPVALFENRWFLIAILNNFRFFHFLSFVVKQSPIHGRIITDGLCRSIITKIVAIKKNVTD